MKKNLALLLTTVLLVTLVLGGCGKTTKDKDGVTYNEKYSEKQMVTTNGTKVSLKDNDRVKMSKTTGLGFVTPDAWEELTNQDGLDPYEYSPVGYYLYYMPQASVDKLSTIDDAASEDEKNQIWSDAYASEFAAFCIYRVNQGDKETLDFEKEVKAEFPKSDKLGTVGDDTFYFAYNDEIGDGDFSDADKADIQKMIDSYQAVKDGVMLFPPTDPMNDFKVDVTSFEAKDLDGNTVTQDIFSDYDVTMINIWATWCKYCVAEMPEIEDLYKELPDNVNIITICSDADTEAETAKELMDQAGVEFKTIVVNDQLKTNVIDYVTGFPTTFFVDKTGKVVGQLQIGTPTDEGSYKDAYMELINGALSEVQGK